MRPKICLLPFTLTALGVSASAQAPIFELTGPQGVAGFGKHVVSLEDLDGDGVGEFAVADRMGTTRLFSGANRALLHTYQPSTIGVGALAAFDVTGDGHDELIIGTAGTTENSSFGFWVVKPEDGTLLWFYGDFTFSGGDELRLAPAGDFDGDGLCDVMIAATKNSPWHPADWLSSVNVVSVQNQFPVWWKRQWGYRMGEGVGSIADVNGDGRREIVLTRPIHVELNQMSLGNRGAVEMYASTSGTTSAFTWQVAGAQPGAELGEALTVIDDVDGDGVEDLITVESRPAASGALTVLRVRSLSGATGAALVHHDLPAEAHPADIHEVEMCRLADLDGDGVAEFAMISPNAAAVAGLSERPVLRIFSGATLDVLQSWSSAAAPFVTFAEHLEIAIAPDLDGDGVRDLLVGAPDVGPSGAVFVLPCKLSVGVEQCAAAVVNSTGRVAHVSLVGHREVALDDLTLTVSDLPAGTFVLPVASRLGGSLPMANGSLGTLCLAGSIVRLHRHLAAASAGGTLEVELDLAGWSGHFGVPPVAAGERWHFQAWFREVGPGGPTSNFSDSREVLLR